MAKQPNVLPMLYLNKKTHRFRDVFVFLIVLAETSRLSSLKMTHLEIKKPLVSKKLSSYKVRAERVEPTK